MGFGEDVSCVDCGTCSSSMIRLEEVVVPCEILSG